MSGRHDHDHSSLSFAAAIIILLWGTVRISGRQLMDGIDLTFWTVPLSVGGYAGHGDLES